MRIKRRILSGFFGFFVCLSALVAAQNRPPVYPDCLAKLHPAAEIYITREARTLLLPTPSLEKNPQSQEDTLHNSSRSGMYEDILRTAVRPDLHALSLEVLSRLEFIHAQTEIGNYEAWLHFLLRSDQATLHHRIFEGLHALFLFDSYRARITFEPKRGFFFDYDRRDAGKSMDLEVRDPETNALLSYKEVKRVSNFKAVSAAMASIVGKAKAIRPLVGEHIEIAGAIYIDGLKLTTDDDRYFESSDLHARVEGIHLQMAGSDVDSLILVDLQLRYYIKIYRLADGSFFEIEGQYPLPDSI